MAATILDAIQNIATPSMIEAATSTLGISETAATTTLGAASTNILAGLIKKSADPAAMSAVSALIAGFTPTTDTFANMAGMLSGGPPASAAQVAGNKLLNMILGDKSASSIATLAFATGCNPQAASALSTLAAPLVLTALRTKLGSGATGAELANLLAADRAVITANMPAPIRSFYGLADAPAAAPASQKAAAPITAMPNVQTASGFATAAAAKVAAAPMAPAAAAATGVAEAEGGSGILALIGLLVPMLMLAALVWYWAYGSKFITSGPAPQPKPAAAAAPAPAPAAPAVEAAPSTK